MSEQSINMLDQDSVSQELEWEAFANAIEEWLDGDEPTNFPDLMNTRPSSPLPSHMVQRISMLHGQIQIVLGEMRNDQKGLANSLRAIRKASGPLSTPTHASYLDTGA